MCARSTHESRGNGKGLWDANQTCDFTHRARAAVPRHHHHRPFLFKGCCSMLPLCNAVSPCGVCKLSRTHSLTHNQTTPRGVWDATSHNSLAVNSPSSDLTSERSLRSYVCVLSGHTTHPQRLPPPSSKETLIFKSSQKDHPFCSVLHVNRTEFLSFEITF